MSEQKINTMPTDGSVASTASSTPLVVEPVPGPATKKRPPGRPRKNPKREPMARSGVSATPFKPDNPDNAVEFIYSEPMIYKNVLNLFKAAAAAEIMFIFDLTEVRILGCDHKGKTLFMVTFDCSNVVHYYCAEKTVATINAAHIIKINEGIGKNNTIVSIILKKAASHKTIIFVFQNEMKIDTRREISLMTPTVDHQSQLGDFEFKDHEISWEWPSGYFKDTISDIMRFTNTFTAQKNGASGKFMFPYKSDDGNIVSQNIIKDPEMSKLVENIAGKDIFAVSVLIEYIKPISMATLSKSIKIYADRSKKMIFVAELDACITVKCAVSIVSATST
jgi:hypothetical protein